MVFTREEVLIEWSESDCRLIKCSTLNSRLPRRLMTLAHPIPSLTLAISRHVHRFIDDCITEVIG